MLLNSLCGVFRNKDELQDNTRVFVKWVLDVGDGKLCDINDGEVEIIIPDELLIHQSIDPIANVVNFTYPHLVDDSVSTG